MKRQSLAAALALGAALLVGVPAAHADDDAGYAALGFFLGNALAGPHVVYSAPRVVVAPPPAYRYYGPPPGYYYYTPPRGYAYPGYRYYWHRGDDDDGRAWRRHERRERHWRDD
jgi:hypothetical protein